MPANTSQYARRTNYDEIKIRARKGARDEIRQHAGRQGESVNAFIQRAIREQIQRDGGQHGGLVALPSCGRHQGNTAAGRPGVRGGVTEDFQK